ncbi:hypothetical protein ACHAXT_000511 [Thalassiosira profunda]
MATLGELATPAFVVNRRAFRRNCERVRASASANGIRRLRPHIKTHKTWEGTLIQAGVGDRGSGAPASVAEVVGLVVSTLPELALVVDMACQHKRRPFSDVLLGVPICISKLAAIQTLRTKLARGTDCKGIIHLLVDHPAQVDFLERFVAEHSASERWSVFLKVDTGYKRAGTTCDDAGASLATKIDMKAIVHDDHANVIKLLNLLEAHLKSRNVAFDTATLDVSVGSTPSMLSHETLEIPNRVEVHAGNYVFYDRQQLYTGACDNEGSIAGLVLTRVIGHYSDSDRNAIMVDAGATALTKDGAPQGDVCSVLGRPELECYRMSQEVTMIRCRDGSTFPPDHPSFDAVGEDLGRQFDDYYVQLVDRETAGFYDGIGDLLLKLNCGVLSGVDSDASSDADGVQLGALTNACVEYAHAVLKANCPEHSSDIPSSAFDQEDKSVYRRFSSIHGANSVPRPKPYGDGILQCCEEMNLRPSQVIYVGDAPTDARAAVDAECRAAIGVLWGSNDEECLKKEEGFNTLCRNVGELQNALEKYL